MRRGCTLGTGPGEIGNQVQRYRPLRARLLGPNPSLNLPGASCARTWACWTTAIGCREKAGVIDVPEEDPFGVYGRCGKYSDRVDSGALQ